MALEFRRLTKADLPGVVELQDKNLVSVLDEAAKADGFLSGSFTQEQFWKMNEDLCVVVCVEGAAVLGFLCASTTEFNLPFPLPAAMIARYPQCQFDGRLLSAWKSYIAGPVCVEREQRGRGIFAGMYSELFRLLPAEIEVAVTLIAKNNPRSIAAHEKLGMQSVNEFEFNGREFFILARPLH